MNEFNLSKIEDMIYVIRQQKVMLDSDLAELYGVETKNLNKAVQRNISRFPGDFMFQLDSKDLEILRFQFGTAKSASKKRFLPYVFTESGEVGYWSSQNHSGIASPALKTILEMAKGAGYKAFHAYVASSNEKSANVLVNNGFSEKADSVIQNNKIRYFFSKQLET